MKRLAVRWLWRRACGLFTLALIAPLGFTPAHAASTGADGYVWEAIVWDLSPSDWLGDWEEGKKGRRLYLCGRLREIVQKLHADSEQKTGTRSLTYSGEIRKSGQSVLGRKLAITTISIIDAGTKISNIRAWKSQASLMNMMYGQQRAAWIDALMATPEMGAALANPSSRQSRVARYHIR